jgi:NADH:ubiquinone oxidoreductase subunit 6 (subunit J)
MTDVLFWVMAALLVAAALGVVLCRNLYHAAYCLAGALITTAVFYLMLTAPLLAAVQILLYTGGVLTMIVFVLVMTARSDDSAGRRKPIPAASLSVLVFLVLAMHVDGLGGSLPVGGLERGREIGIAVFTTYIVPFELLSVLLLAAIFGALMIARKEEDR